VQVGSFTDGAVIVPVWDALSDTASVLGANTVGLTTVAATGDVITQYVSLESFADSMLVSLPVAILLTLLLATVLLRSFRYALASVVPIGFVVTGVYAFMTIAGYTINVVTATIAAIAVGVGIDFSTHLTARYREELQHTSDHLEELRIAGAGTGGAPVLSALTSVLGFTVMAFAPTPIFSTFGVLTAVMVALALASCLVVLPSILLIMTPRQHEPVSQRILPADKEWGLAR
jgi:predicted RND superfamily exporter protein